LSHISGIDRRFSRSAATYDEHAATQRHIAQTLCAHIEVEAPTEILELGCGTGFLTLPLLNKFKNANFTITDLSSDMLAQTRQKLQQYPRDEAQNIALSQLDFNEISDENSVITKHYNLIAASMALHWSDIQATLKRLQAHLTPTGRLYFSTIGPRAFKEWRSALEACGFQSGLRLPPVLPGIFKQEEITITYESATAFLNQLRETGAHGPRSGYTPLSPGKLKRAMAMLEQLDSTHNKKPAITWDIHYGTLTAAPLV
jgi:malonyl-ACP O-methyltransferase BioC